MNGEASFKRRGCRLSIPIDLKIDNLESSLRTKSSPIETHEKMLSVNSCNSLKVYVQYHID